MSETEHSPKELYFGEYQEIYKVGEKRLLIDSAFKALPRRTHPLEESISQHETNQLGYYAIELEGFVNVFDDDNTLLGGMVLHRRWNTVSIYSFFIEEYLRGKGVGKHMLSIAEKQAKEMGANVIILETSTLHSFQFYLKNGFTVTHESEDIIEGQCYFYMKKFL